MGTIQSIFISSKSGEAMQDIPRATLVPGMGIVGDRYAIGAGEFSPAVPDADHEVTLIEIEQVRAFNAAEAAANRELADRPLEPAEMRRNLVTVGVDLNALVGVEFTVGEVRLRGIRLCEPCAFLSARTRESVLRGFAHRGGLRTGIVRGGTIEVNCSVRVDS